MKQPGFGFLHGSCPPLRTDTPLLQIPSRPLREGFRRWRDKAGKGNCQGAGQRLRRILVTGGSAHNVRKDRRELANQYKGKREFQSRTYSDSLLTALAAQ